MSKRKPIPKRRKRAQSSPKQTSSQPSKLRWLCPIICGVCAVGAVLLLAVYETTSRASAIRQTPDAKKTLADVTGKATEYGDDGHSLRASMIFPDSGNGTNSSENSRGIMRRLTQETTSQLGNEPNPGPTGRFKGVRTQ